MIALVKPSQPSKLSRRKPTVIVKENLPRLVESWLRRIAVDRAPDTVTTYRAQLRAFQDWARDEGLSLHVEAFGKEHINAHLEAMKERGLARATMRLRHAALKAFWSWLVEEEYTDANPATKVKGIRKRVDDKTKLPKILPDVELRRIIAACRGNDFNSRRDMAMIRVLLDTGVRRGELANMEWARVDLERQTIETTGKRGVRLLPFNLRTRNALDAYLIARETSHYAESPMLWLGQMGPLTRMGCYQALKRRARKAGIETGTHTFRHTWAAAYKAAGGSLEDIAEIGGWQSLEMVRVYGRVTAHERAMEDYKRRGLGDRV